MALTNSYASLAQLKARVRKTASTEFDAELERVLVATSRAIDRFTGRRFWLDPAPTARLYRPRRDSDCLTVSDIGSSAGVIVETDDGSGAFATAWSGTEFLLEPFDAELDDPVPEPYTRISSTTSGRWFRAPISTTRPTVRVTARHGWPGATVASGVAAAPPDVVEATLLKAARLFRRRDTPDGVAGTTETGIVRISRQEDPDVALLLENGYVRQDGGSGMAGIG